MSIEALLILLVSAVIAAFALFTMLWILSHLW